MRIELSDPGLVDDLLAFLRRHGFIAVRTGPSTIEASPAPQSLRQNHIRMELELRLALWRAQHPEVEAQLVI